MTKYRSNHYVPVWYQERFFPQGVGERKFFYLDLRPDTVVSNGHSFRRNSLLQWGPKSCFCQDDLYTTKYGSWVSTEIEEKFFGPVDAFARPSLDYFANFTHPSAAAEHFQRLVLYMSIQKLRTPKGLAYLSEFTRQFDKNRVLIELQHLQQIFGAIWTECVWSIADASQAETKFLLSDHPVTVYNQGCFPASDRCRGYRDPEIWLTGTHTFFPLTLDKILILTNLSWVRYPYGNPLKPRPNPNPFRPAMFNFLQIQTGRKLSDQEVVEINYIIKARAYRYVAAVNRSWLSPEERIGVPRWDSLGEDYLLMPDPRSVAFSGEVFVGYDNNKVESFDAYGRKPWQSDYNDKTQHDREWETFHAFQGEFARRFGPKRRGLAFESDKLTNEQDTEDFHKYHLSLEQKFKKYRYKPRRPSR
jgi:hypothetical protein